MGAVLQNAYHGERANATFDWPAWTPQESYDAKLARVAREAREAAQKAARKAAERRPACGLPTRKGGTCAQPVLDTQPVCFGHAKSVGSRLTSLLIGG